MGRVAVCTVISGRQRAAGKARLESTEVEFSGRFRLKIPLADITSAEADRGELRIQYLGKAVTFLLGADAGKWAERIRSPRTVLDKLGVKPGQRVALIAVPASDLRRQLVTRGAAVVDRLPRQPVEVVILGASAPRDLLRLSSLRRAITPAGAVWVLWPKGRRELNENHVRAAALANDLVDVKVVSFSVTHSALKLVVPGASR